MSSPRVWLITGASTGFGLEMTRCALAHGDKVVATLRKPAVLADFASQYPSSQLLVVKLDVTNETEIKEAFQKAKDAFGRIDVVFNNAGIVVSGETEGILEDAARKMFETNFWGAVHVTLEAVRFFREVNKPQGGHLIQNTGSTGFISLPLMGYYGDSLVGLEGITDTLVSFAATADPPGQFTSIEPGAFPTELGTNGQMVAQPAAYTDPSMPTSLMRAAFANPEAGNEAMAFGFNDTAKAVQKVFELTRLPNPPLRLPLGRDAVKFLSDTAAEYLKVVEEYASWSDNLAIAAK